MCGSADDADDGAAYWRGRPVAVLDVAMADYSEMGISVSPVRSGSVGADEGAIV